MKKKDNRNLSYTKQGPGRKHRSGPGREFLIVDDNTLERATKRAASYMHAAARLRYYASLSRSIGSGP